jgi:hypothetical protein
MIDSIVISDNAVLICNFLELSIVDKRARKNPAYNIPFSNIPYIEYDAYGDEHQEGWIDVDTHVRASDTFFHSDWTWLMEVVDKIEAHHPYQDVEIKGNRCFMGSSSALDDCFDDWFEADTKIEAVYIACIEFIKWYNKK